jgi:GT2 family glycosyltransferase
VNQHPKVSVVIPVFNDFIRLDKCLSSLADQTYKGEVEEYVNLVRWQTRIEDILYQGVSE